MIFRDQLSKNKELILNLLATPFFFVLSLFGIFLAVLGSGYLTEFLIDLIF